MCIRDSAYRDTHRSQQKGDVAPLTYTSEEDIVASVVSAVLFAYENHKESGTNFPIFSSEGVEKLYSNVFLFNPSTGKNESTRLEIIVGINPRNGQIEVSNFYPVMKLR